MFEFTRSDGKMNWPYLRQILYVLLFVWVVGVQFMNVNPFDDFGEGPGQDVTLATLLDFVSLVAIYLFTWHVMYAGRPRV
jgi:hypothetical protein